MQKKLVAHATPLLYPAGAVDLASLPRVHLEEHESGPLA